METTEQKAARFADTIWAYQDAQCAFEEALEAAGLKDGEHYQSIGWDHYDVSIELYKVANEVRLTAEQQRVIRDAGFGRVFVNHLDGWETHYSWDWRDVEFKPHRGWRRRWVADPAVQTTRTVGVEAAPEHSGYYEISYWPEGWTQKSTSSWLSSGYMRIVPDPLDLGGGNA